MSRKKVRDIDLAAVDPVTAALTAVPRGPASARGRGSRLLGALSSLLTTCLAVGPAQAQERSPSLSFEGELVHRASQWHEKGNAGSTLLTERGSLDGIALGARWQSGDWSLRLRWQGLGGERDYDGQTNLGTRVQTTTQLRESLWTLGAARTLSPEWQLIGELQPTHLTRDLRSTPSAVGYTEDWRWTLALVGARWNRELADGVLVLHAAVGAPLRTRLAVTLPGRDAATLDPGIERAVRLGVAYHRNLGAALGLPWVGHVGLQWQQIRFGASPVVPSTSNGVVVGGVFQPETRLRDAMLNLTAEARWR